MIFFVSKYEKITAETTKIKLLRQNLLPKGPVHDCLPFLSLSLSLSVFKKDYLQVV